MKVICDNCKEEFEFKRSSYWLRVNKHNFCDIYCYREWRKDITNHPHWKGGKVQMLNYEFTKAPEHPFASVTGYVKTSRLVMENHLRRYLKPTETVHHINKVRNDNRLENLKLFKSNGEHIRHHAFIRKHKKQLQLA